MTAFFYNTLLLLYKSGIRVAALWNSKARQWVKGRKDIFEQIDGHLTSIDQPITWVHCSSLGEFEQGRPVIEKLRSLDPDCKILLTFFSPSGYEVRKDFAGVDWVFYLPIDSRSNAKRFIDIIRPQLAIFIKYDYWYHYLNECKKRNIPLVMVSALFRREQPFFRWYGSLHRKMLNCFSHFFVQDKESADLLNSVGLANVTISGDTRFDRVAEIANSFKPIDDIEKFCGHAQVLVAGSTWPADEKIIKEAIADFPNLKIIIAPHEIHEKHLVQLKQFFPDSAFYSQFTCFAPLAMTTDLLPVSPARSHNGESRAACLIIDNIGMLSRLYHYATITYIGGGFDKGIHNALEAAVYGKPVLFGPNYKKFNEAIGLIATGGGISIRSANDLRAEIKDLLTDPKKLANISKRSSDFVKQNQGATEKIMNKIQEKRRFTNW
ncbi:MAG TPA: glycosyltransferase N-terminal domain-containing protein [Chitinophagaceae bacterium]|nr:glycosyltransferase N-terminal domain-containing protein [Chitinophagaceae bacterium]